MPLNEAERAALDKRLLAAHSDEDCAALIALYLEAAARVGADEAQGFYLTHAYVFALEAGDPRAHDIKAQLVAMGREL